jgi:anti-sigma B factor antagonist
MPRRVTRVRRPGTSVWAFAGGQSATGVVAVGESTGSFDQRSFIAELDDVAAVLKSSTPGHAGHEGWTLRSSGVLTCSCGEALYSADAAQLPPEHDAPAHDGAGVVVHAPPEIDIATADAFSRALSDAFAARPAEVVVDLSRTTFCDSTALRLLVNARRQAERSDCRLVLASPPRQLLLMADVLGVTALLGLRTG